MKLIIFLILFGSILNATTIVNNYLKQLKQEIKKENPTFTSFSYERGEDIFTSSHIGKKGKKISCSSCHTNDLTQVGENFFTGKNLKPLSPKVNSKSLTKLKKIKKWLKRNFKDVYKREGTSLEKGDVLTYIINQ